MTMIYTDNRATAGSLIEVLPAYDMDTGGRTDIDEITFNVYRVIEDCDGDLGLGAIDGPGFVDMWLSRGRCKVLNAPTY